MRFFNIYYLFICGVFGLRAVSIDNYYLILMTVKRFKKFSGIGVLVMSGYLPAQALLRKVVRGFFTKEIVVGWG
jgi:hypothetical protein